MTLRRVFTWLLPLSLLVVAIVGVPSLLFDEQGLPRYQALHQELDKVERSNAALRRQLRKLKKDVEALKTDAKAIEHIARDELGMVKSDEIVFNFDE